MRLIGVESGGWEEDGRGDKRATVARVGGEKRVAVTGRRTRRVFGCAALDIALLIPDNFFPTPSIPDSLVEFCATCSYFSFRNTSRSDSAVSARAVTRVTLPRRASLESVVSLVTTATLARYLSWS